MYKFSRQRALENLKAVAGGKPFLIDSNKHLNELLKSGRIDEAQKVFDQMPERDECTWNTMVSGYANSGKLVEARKLLDESPRRSSITWSSLVSGYCKMGCEAESFQLLYQMQHEGYRPNRFALGSVLRLCSIKGLLSRGEQIHGFSVKACMDTDVFVVTSLIDVYAKCRCIDEAEYLFERMNEGKNHVTWTAMLNGYSINGDTIKTTECFVGMRANGVEANQYTFPGVLAACGARSNLRFGTQVHGCIFRGGFLANVFVQSALVDMYTKCGDLSGAVKIVDSMETDDLISWNALILGCVRLGFPEKALSLFNSMHVKGMKPDEFTYPSVLNSFAVVKNVTAGKNIHALVIKSGFEAYTLVCNALIDMYAKQETHLDVAFKLFDFLEDRDVISWTSLVTGCAYCGLHEEALKLFCDMRVGGTHPDRIILSSVLSSCAELALLDFGQQLHSDSIKSGIDSSLSVDNSLVSLYAHCGCLESAEKIFDSMGIRNVVSWTALIVGYAKNGKGTKSIQFYDRMIESGLKPDSITFVGLLFACSHAGLTEQGRNYFNSMVKDHGISPGPNHYACMIDLFARSGEIDEAEKLLNEMTVKPDSTLWKSLLSACRVHGNIDLAEKAAKALIELEPRGSFPYVMLSNMYSQNGKWHEAARVRKSMKSRGVEKEPGFSWIGINGKVHNFLSEDRSHVETDEIYRKIDEVMVLIKEFGYVPDLKFALHDVNEENKVFGLAYHSEKLAVAFGLLKLPAGAPVRIYKNMRVCGDCHNAMKFVSRVYGRRVIMRDSNCFHHFEDGVCSCGDYW
ncbi:pentatricopeptide repeat-containing protein [Striga asiatica]|uniref:Pentatricopeptide repeat-containing protein n=1 Tax=Striga asiatica TaxID=4170 RepID=A0A5A7RJX5_STRAF|nr:pentatricopeptide repeat-containing protein [Striga asiatica]